MKVSFIDAIDCDCHMRYRHDWTNWPRHVNVGQWVEEVYGDPNARRAFTFSSARVER